MSASQVNVFEIEPSRNKVTPGHHEHPEVSAFALLGRLHQQTAGCLLRTTSRRDNCAGRRSEGKPGSSSGAVFADALERVETQSLDFLGQALDGDLVDDVSASSAPTSWFARSAMELRIILVVAVFTDLAVAVAISGIAVCAGFGLLLGFCQQLLRKLLCVLALDARATQ